MLKHTWKDKCYDVVSTIPSEEQLKILARKKILRAYVLTSEEKYYAFVLGYVYKGVYHYSDLGYNEKVARYSPGTVLLYCLINDLINRKDVKSVNFEIYDARYKRKFGNNHSADCSF
jgi:CelD/BcsL family acetyltransferase involved in cellulose biosynthesis